MTTPDEHRRNAIEKAAIEAAIAAAQEALDAVAVWPRTNGDRLTAEAAVRAAAPVLRRAFAEEAAQAIEARRAALVQTDDWDDGTDSLLAAAEIAREVGRG